MHKIIHPVKTGRRNSASQKCLGKLRWEVEDEGKAAGGTQCFRKATVHPPTAAQGGIARRAVVSPSSAFLRIFSCSPPPRRTHPAQHTDLCLSQRDQKKGAHSTSQCSLAKCKHFIRSMLPWVLEQQTAIQPPFFIRLSLEYLLKTLFELSPSTK